MEECCKMLDSFLPAASESQTQKDLLAASAIPNHGISVSAASSKKNLNSFNVLIEINDKEIKSQITEQAK